MSRVALFVDAGYLLAGAHDLMGGPVSRSAYDCNYEALLAALRQEVESRSAPLTFLRAYWYDGARNGIPTTDHRRIGDQHYVKVRLGRLNMKGQQKGVDGLIYRDLTTLARAGVIHRAYLFTGDEDIRESVAAAQDLGVQVVLMSFKPTAQTGRSAELAREADEVIILDPGFWPPHFVKRQVSAPASGPLAERALEALEAHPARIDTPLLFTTRRGTPIDLHRWRSRQWTPALRAAGLPHRGPYAMRHTYASWAIAAGLPTFEIAATMGTSLEQLSKTYAHLLPDSADRARVALDAYINQAAPSPSHRPLREDVGLDRT